MKNYARLLIAVLLPVFIYSCTITRNGTSTSRAGVSSRPVADNKISVKRDLEKEYNLDEIIPGDRGKATVKKDAFGDAYIEDGRNVKIKVEKSIMGETIVKDKNGKETKIKKDIFGDTYVEDSKGNKSKVEKDIFGNTILKDKDGKKTKITKDIHGDTYIEDEKGNKKKVKSDIFGRVVLE